MLSTIRLRSVTACLACGFLGLTPASTRADGPPKAAISSGGHGLVGMAERAAALGGTCQAGPADGGWRVRACLPLTPAQVA